jgi:hypothetical protein
MKSLRSGSSSAIGKFAERWQSDVLSQHKRSAQGADRAVVAFQQRYEESAAPFPSNGDLCP